MKFNGEKKAYKKSYTEERNRSTISTIKVRTYTSIRTS